MAPHIMTHAAGDDHADADRLVEDPAEQVIVDEVRDLRESGLSFSKIVDELARRGRVGRTGHPLNKTRGQRIHAALADRIDNSKGPS
jgi:hypothetical protein